jgi:hypothetical protein
LNSEALADAGFVTKGGSNTILGLLIFEDLICTPALICFSSHYKSQCGGPFQTKTGSGATPSLDPPMRRILAHT